MNLATTPDDLSALSDVALLEQAAQAVAWQVQDRQDNALLYYRPVSERAARVHQTPATIIGVGGGNRSSKTTTTLAELVICMTGIIPYTLRSTFDRAKLRGPVRCRMVIESLTTTLHPVILPKLQHWHWEGVGRPGGTQGHWGWIPKHCLIDGDWEHSWSEKLRMLRVLYRDPDNLDAIMGESTMQFMSFDQDPSDFASGEFHHILLDEPPPYAIFRENRARVMSVGGRILLAMTWPDNPAIPVEWIFDEIYEKGLPGPKRDPGVEWVNLDTRENPHIDQAAIERMAAGMSRLERLTRIEGQPIRFSNRIHPLFTNSDTLWCFTCGEERYQLCKVCPVCGSDNVIVFNHASEFAIIPTLPTIYLLDPHPRKPHMMLWVQVDANDDLWVVMETEVQDEPKEVKKRCDEIERQHHLHVVKRLMDPNMGRTPSGINRSITWQDEFERVGHYCETADDSDVGRAKINDYLRPDQHTKRPRLHAHAVNCPWTVHQFGRYVWHPDRQKPIPEHDDYPTLIKYLMNSEPSYRYLKAGYAPVRVRGERSVRGY